MLNTTYATEEDAKKEVKKIVERWNAQRKPFSDVNAEIWVNNCDVIAQRMIEAQVVRWVEDAFTDMETHEELVIPKEDLESNIYSGFVVIMHDFLERHRSTTPPSSQSGSGGHSQGSIF